MTTVTPDFGDGLAWRKASRSGDQGGNCVCVAASDAGLIGIRDSKQGQNGRPQWYTDAAWRTFLAGVKAGEFDIN